MVRLTWLVHNETKGVRLRKLFALFFGSQKLLFWRRGATPLPHTPPAMDISSISTCASIECFHSRGQNLCKFIGTKESVCIRKEFNSHKVGLGHQHGRRFIVLGHQYGRRDVMWKHSIKRCDTSVVLKLQCLKMQACSLVIISVQSSCLMDVLGSGPLRSLHHGSATKLEKGNRFNRLNIWHK